ncbi:serine/threonine protein kinase [Verrucomicrobiaceae bacterium N1E253]|uniref:Serine/threonine protein kinase n=1 Tax=Oceaniferula marina TaxID=2748318 RepID=A0A851GK60_9BACT|nr:serine/threonine-protein kinase [Oceaniferula marina]NWK55100.1 serine/threonine protein kinase [Oceaniferula marina]
MAEHELSRQALIQAFQDAAEHFSEVRSLERKLSEPRYEDQDLLGEGGAKLVYLTLDRVTGRRLVRAYPKNKELEDDFLREATLHAHLEHPNIVPFYDMGLEDGRPFFCMKRIQGDTLQRDVQKHRQNLNQPAVRNDLLDAFIKVCDAVSYAHAHEVLHLDLKPSNIQLSSYGEVLVGDWGLARLSGDEVAGDGAVPLIEQSTGQFTRHGYLSGTPGFMAPEQCKKGTRKTAQTDVYALGAILVYIITGKQPISAKTNDDVMAATLAGEWSFSLDAIPEGLRAVVSKALEVDCSNRYVSVQDLRNDINAYRAGYLTSAEDYSSRRLLQSLYRRNKAVVRIVASALAVLLSMTAVFIYHLRLSERAAQDAKGEAVNEQHNTQKALDLLKQAQAEKEQQGEVFANDYLEESISYYQANERGRYFYSRRYDKKAYQMVNKALELNPDDPEAWALKGRLAMLTNRLGVAIQAFQRAGEKYSIHSEVCEKYRSKDIQDPRVLSAMLWQLLPSNDLRLVHDFMYKTIYDRSLPKEDVIYFIEESLNMRNLGPKPRLHFEYDTGKQALDMSDNKQLQFIFMIKNLPLREVNFSNTSIGHDFYHLDRMPLVKVNVAHTGMNNRLLSYFTGRPIRELILTGCNVSDLSALRDLPLVKIDVRGTKVTDFSPIAASPELREVWCHEGQKENLLRSGISVEKLVIHDDGGQ